VVTKTVSVPVMGLPEGARPTTPPKLMGWGSTTSRGSVALAILFPASVTVKATV
jgi:hypothetical protein